MPNTYHLKKNLPTHDDALEYIVALHAVLDECADYFDNKSDVLDGDYGVPEPNKEMRLLSMIKDIM
jgi:hypothetical protein